MTVVPINGRRETRPQAPEKGGLVAALDIGSAKIACLIAEVRPPRHRGADKPELRIIGCGHQVSRGVKSGTIVDIDETERAIRLAVDAAERMAQAAISSVTVNVSGGRPRSTLCSATIPLPLGEADRAAIDAAIQAALASADLGRRQLLQAAPVSFRLDNGPEVASPDGLFGETLEARVSVVSAEAAALRNLALAVERCHLAVSDRLVAPYAAARAVLAKDEMYLGVTLLDLGGATTGIAAFRGGHMVFADTIPIGGHHITTDLARGLSTTVAHAERMKTLYGSALASVCDERETIAVPLLGERGVDTVHNVPKSLLSGIIRPRLEEIFDLTRQRLEASGVSKLTGSRAVITGGGSQLTGAREIGTQWLGRKVRLGTPLPLPGMPEQAQFASFAVAAGLLLAAVDPPPRYDPPKAAAAIARARPPGYVRRVGRWLADSL